MRITVEGDRSFTIVENGYKAGDTFCGLPIKETRSSFELGRVVVTSGVQELELDFLAYLARHGFGDWGDVDAHDAQANERSVKNGSRILSVYHHGETKFYVLTEADRSVTTFLLPSEY